MSEKLQAWLQIIGLAGVIASLLFVGYELKQAREIAMAEVFASKTQISQAVALSMFNGDAWRKVTMQWPGVPEEVTQEEMRALLDGAALWLEVADFNHHQYQLGLLTQEQWNTWLAIAHRRVLVGPPAWEWWCQQVKDGIYRPSFARAIEGSALSQLPRRCSQPAEEAAEPSP